MLIGAESCHGSSVGMDVLVNSGMILGPSVMSRVHDVAPNIYKQDVSHPHMCISVTIIGEPGVRLKRKQLSCSVARGRVLLVASFWPPLGCCDHFILEFRQGLHFCTPVGFVSKDDTADDSTIGFFFCDDLRSPRTCAAGNRKTC